MTLDTNNSKAVFQGNGTATVFPFDFKVWKNSQIVVTIADNDETSTDVTPDCSITLTESGGTVTYLKDGAPLPAGYTLVITRNMPFVQGVDLVSATRFDPQVIEDALDQATAERQQLAERLARAVVVETTSSLTPEDLVQSIYTARDEAKAAGSAAGQSAAEAAGSAGEAGASAATATEQADRAKAEADRAQTAAENAEAIAGTATEITLGGVRLATQEQAETGTESGAYAMTPQRVSQHLAAKFSGHFDTALAAQTGAEPVANKIPLADGDGKLASGWLPAATHEQPGAVKLTSTPSATDGSAAITPKGAHDTVVANAGKVSLLSTRSTTGDWTITGLTVGKPLIVLMSRGASVSTYAQLHALSGAVGGTSPLSSYGFFLGHISAYAASNTFTCIPTGNTVTLKINHLAGGATLWAYQ